MPAAHMLNYLSGHSSQRRRRACAVADARRRVGELRLAADEADRLLRANLGAGARADAGERIDNRVQRRRLGQARLDGFVQVVPVLGFESASPAQIEPDDRDEREHVQRDSERGELEHVGEEWRVRDCADDIECSGNAAGVQQRCESP